MAGRVLIEQRVVEQQAGLADGGVVGYQRALAQIGTALVHGDELGQQVVVLLRVPLHGLALVESDPEAVDELTLIAQGLGGVDNALRLAAHGGDKALLRGDIGVEDDALQALFAAAAELGLGDHAHLKIGAVGALVAQLPDVQAVEVGAAVVHILVVGVPVGHGVALQRTAGGQDSLPQLLHRLGLPQVGEQLLGPRLAGYGGDAPLVLVLDLVAVLLDDGVLALLALGHLLLIDAVETVRVLAEQVDAAGDGVHIVLPARLLVVIQLGQGGQRAVAEVQLLEGLVVPVHHHLLGLALIALLHQHLHELRLIQLGGDKDLLPRLDVDAAAGDEAGVLPQNALFHGNCSFHVFQSGTIVPPSARFEKTSVEKSGAISKVFIPADPAAAPARRRLRPRWSQWVPPHRASPRRPDRLLCPC